MLDPVTGAYLIGGSMGLNAVTSGLNYYQQRKNLEYQKWAQRRQWAREDTAVQRRVADLKASGMSKVLAAGQGASSSPPIQTHAPQLETSGFDPLRVVKGFLDITQTQAQADLTRANATYQEALNAGGKAQSELDLLVQNNKTAQALEAQARANARLSKEKGDTEFWNRYWAINAKLPTNASGWTQFAGAFGAQIVGLQEQMLREYKAGNKAYMNTMAQWENAVENAVKEAIKTGKAKPSIIPTNAFMRQ